MITVACLTSLVALNGKNHAGTRNSAAFTVTQPLERAQNDAFGPPTEHTHVMCVHTGRGSKYSAAEHAKVLGPDAAAAPPTVATFQLGSLLPGLVRRRCYESRRESKVTRRG